MPTRVVVREFMHCVLLSVAPGPDAGHFEHQPVKGLRVARRRLHHEAQQDIPTGWVVYKFDPIKRWDLMDYLVAHFDADVDWPDYQWGLENLRKRRDRLKQPPMDWHADPLPRSKRSRPAQPQYPKPVVAAYGVLNCSVGVDLETVQRAYRERSMECHPDRGGSTAQMSRINHAVAILRTYLGRLGNEKTG